MSSQAAIGRKPDIRFLGKLLGDVIRAYGGETLFRRIEYIRSASVDRHLGVSSEKSIGSGALTLDDTLAFVRGFMLFSMLANSAEDRKGISVEPGATFAGALAKLREAYVGGEAVTALLDHALIAPVLTAHPTEVRRKSMIDHRNQIAKLIRLRDGARRRRRRAISSRKRSSARSPCSGGLAHFAASGCMSLTSSRWPSPIFAKSFCRCVHPMLAGSVP
jgi:phosphoenolpyruvate carboxylase